MEISQRQIENYLNNPPPGQLAVLLFGGNEGLIRERARRIAEAICADLDDPFQVVRLSGNDLRDDPARLADEFGALAMLGGRRVIFLSGPNSQMLNALKPVLAGEIAGDALVIVEAPDMAKTAALTKLFVSTKSAAAIGCYPDDLRSITGLVGEVLSDRGLTAAPDVVATLCALLGEDRGIIRQRLEMLVLYKGEDHSPVALEEITRLFDTGPAHAIHGLTEQVFNGNINKLPSYLAVCKARGHDPSMVLRSLAGHAGLLRHIQARRQSGADWKTIFRGLRPPVHFSRQPQYRRFAEMWPGMSLQKCQSLLLDAETKCRTRTQIAPVIAERALMAVSRMAPAGHR